MADSIAGFPCVDEGSGWKSFGKVEFPFQIKHVESEYVFYLRVTNETKSMEIAKIPPYFRSYK